MWPEYTTGVRERWQGFRDALGDRLVVEWTSGLRSEGLLLAPTVAADGGLWEAIIRSVGDASEVSHPALRPSRDVQRDRESGTPVLVSDYIPGLRLSSWLASRQDTPVATSTVLHIARQVSGALKALSDHSPGAFHGAVGLERVVLTADGRVLLTEAGLGPLFAAHRNATPQSWWSEFRLAVPFMPDSVPFGQATDACQLGLMVLELLLGRELRHDEYPDGLALLLGTAEETDLVGRRSPLGAGLFEWLNLAFALDAAGVTPTIQAVAEALDDLVSDDAGYVAVALGLETQPETLAPVRPASAATGEAEAPGQPGGFAESALADFMGSEPAARAPGERAEPKPPSAFLPEAEIARGALTTRPAEPSPVPTTSVRRPEAANLLPEGLIGAFEYTGSGANATSGLQLVELSEADELEFFPAGDGGAPTPPVAVPGSARWAPATAARPLARRDAPPPGRVRKSEAPRRGWSRTLRWGVVAIALTGFTVGGTGAWTSWRERTIGLRSGRLVVESEPAGATILIDGIDRGKAPVSLVVPPGRHEVTAKSASGSGRASVEVTVGGRHDLTVPLELGSDPGVVDISTDPPGAAIVLDGVVRGRSPLALPEVAPGDHTLIVEHGPARVERRFTLAPAERLTFFVPLAGWLTVRAAVPLRVADRGKVLGVTSAGRFLVQAGRRRLEFVNDEYGVNLTQDVAVVAGQSASLDIALPAGVLSVSADVAASVWIDGTPRGRTPTGNIALPIGEHEVVVSDPRLGEQRLTVIVGVGVPTRLSVKLEGPTPPRSTPQRGAPKRSGISAAR
jgi:hypothetical protein